MDELKTELAALCVKEFNRREGERGIWESFWDEIAELVEPNYRNTFRKDDYNTPGERKTDRQLDSTPTMALGRFAAALDSYLTPRNQTWHRLVPSDRDLLKDRDVRLYFDKLNRVLFDARYAPSANFSSQNQQVYRSLGAFGGGSMFIDRPTRGRGLRYKSLPLGETYWKENHQGIIDDVIRAFKLTADQILEIPAWRKAVEAVDENDQLFEQANKNDPTKHVVLHWVRPRRDYDPSAFGQRSMPYESVYVLHAKQWELQRGGYRSFPMPSTRYDQAPGETYGRSPAMQVLPAIKTLNVEKRITLKQGHRASDPILLVPDDSILQNVSLRPGSAVPGGMNSDGRALVGVLPHGNFQIAKEMMDDERAVINDAFLVTLFQILMDTPRMTATEVIQRATEKGVLLAPMLGRQTSEYLGPTIDREIEVLAQQGLAPEMPPALAEAEGEYTVQYDSPLSKMARAQEASGFTNVLQIMLPAINVTGDPTPLDNFDFDVIARELSDQQAVPATWMKAADVVQQQRAQRAQQQAAMAQAQMAPQMLQGVAAAKKAGVTGEDLA